MPRLKPSMPRDMQERKEMFEGMIQALIKREGAENEALIRIMAEIVKRSLGDVRRAADALEHMADTLEIMQKIVQIELTGEDG